MSNGPLLTREQVRRLDRLAGELLGIASIVLMENAGRGATEVALAMLGGGRGPVAIVCGAGNNGGDGFVVARHLHNAGVAVQCWLLAPAEKLRGDAATNHGICVAMGLPVRQVDAAGDALAGSLGKAELIVDGILGTGFSLPGQVRSPADAAIEAINAAGRPVLAVDVPSGLDCDSGRAAAVCVRATATVTFAAAKTGLLAPEAGEYVGRLTVVGIGTPPELIDRVREEHG